MPLSSPLWGAGSCQDCSGEWVALSGGAFQLGNAPLGLAGWPLNLYVAWNLGVVIVC